MKKHFGTIFIIILAFITTFSFSGCSLGQSKLYESEAGISVTLPDGFYEKSYITATYYLESSDVLFLVTKEDFSSLSIVDINANSTLDDYAEVVIYQNSLVSNIIHESGLTYFVYYKTISSKTYYYFAVVKKGSDSFWLCQFVCDNSDRDEYQPKFLEWAQTIQVV